jgi:glycosyltransferase involved in cell wall biosynthesis
LGGRRPGVDVPAVYVEHNVPQGRIDGMRHDLADRRDLVLVHVSHFNALFWDSGAAPTVVIEHGVVDPGPRYTGELPAAAVVVNEPCRRGRVTGTDLLAPLAQRVPLDVFGMRVVELPPTAGLAVHEDLPQDQLHREIARRAAYVHPYRWTSLGLALIEAMLLAMPVVALATTEVPDVVPADAGVVSTQPSVLARGVERFLWDPADAQVTGKRARDAALARFGLDRFLADWNRLLEEVTR